MTRLFVLAWISIVFNSCYANDDLAEKLNSPSVQRLADKLKAELRGRDMPQSRSMLFIYFGPIGWSNGDVRIEVGNKPKFETKYIELPIQPDFIAIQMLEDGVDNINLAIKKYSKHYILADLDSCPKLEGLIADLKEATLQQLQNDIKPKNFATVQTDGGFSNNFYFNVDLYKSFSYTTYLNGKGNLALKQMAELRKYLESCGNDDIRTQVH